MSMFCVHAEVVKKVLVDSQESHHNIYCYLNDLLASQEIDHLIENARQLGIKTSGFTFLVLKGVRNADGKVIESKIVYYNSMTSKRNVLLSATIEDPEFCMAGDNSESFAKSDILSKIAWYYGYTSITYRYALFNKNNEETHSHDFVIEF